MAVELVEAAMAEEVAAEEATVEVGAVGAAVDMAVEKSNYQ